MNPLHAWRINHPVFIASGRRGGQAGRGKAKARTTEQAQAAISARWEKYALAHPGWVRPAERVKAPLNPDAGMPQDPRAV